MAAPPSDPTVLSADALAPPSGAAAVSRDAGEAANDAAAPPSSARLVAEAKDSAPPPSGTLFRDGREAMLAFLASRQKKEGQDFLRSVIIRKLGEDVEPELMGELLQAAFTRCVEAKSPPRFAWGVRGWVARVTRRAIASYFKAREDDEANIDKDADAVEWSDRRAPKTDYGARAHLINKFLAARIGNDPRKIETFRLMTEHEVEGYSLPELAQAHGTTERALANRFHKLRKELAPQVALMDREKPRRAILLLLFLGGLALVVGLIWWIVQLTSPQWASPPPAHRVHAPRAVVAPPPSFDNAQPTQPPAPQPPAVPDGPKEGKP